MTDRELMQQALEALDYMHQEKCDYMRRNNLGDPLREDASRLALPAITALRTRLAQPEPEPVAWMDAYDRTELYYRKPPQADVVPLYRAPPPQAQPESDPDPSRCPKCGGEADNGHDRCDPPNPYHCTKCMAQPEPEPVAQYIGECQGGWLVQLFDYIEKGAKLYTAPPARQWVDLTDGDKQDLYTNYGVSLAAMHFVSERLKAKNGG